MSWRRFLSIAALLSFSFVINGGFADTALKQRQIIVYVWDGLRPDSVTAQTTPHLFALMQRGVAFKDNHASYPTFTMMNASSFATGDFAGKTGFFGNTLWSPKTTGADFAGKTVDFEQPVFTEDYAILQDLAKTDLVNVTTLLQLAHQQHITTAVVGKSGPAFFQDYKSGGIIFDEKLAYPLSFAQQLQKDGYALPKTTYVDYPTDEQSKLISTQNPTAPTATHYLQDGVTPDPTDHSGSPFSQANEYMMKVYLQEILPKYHPQLSVVWMRNPDTTEHLYGPGSANYLAALKSNDDMLGDLEKQLQHLKLDKTTDIVVVSDHGHSNVSGPYAEFPLREVINGNIGKISAQGYTVSGEVRVADLLTKAGFHAFDGQGCNYDPVLSGILKNGNPLYSTKVDQDGSICGTKESKYITPAYIVPATAQLPNDAVIVAANGGSDYFYIPSHNPKLVQQLVKYFQSHEQFGAIFVDASHYGKLAGTLPLATVNLENQQGRSPDIIVGFSYDEKATMQGLPGIEFSDASNDRGMHGSFSPIDVHNFMTAIGPDFNLSQQDHLPTGNVDLAPTLAYLLQLDLSNTDGRVLLEALNQKSNEKISVKPIAITSQPVQQLLIYDATGKDIGIKTYQIFLHIKSLTVGQKNYYYFDSARAVRH
jgi:predicted AlkP superfamily pyrophosphatase or phosphodiesterase